MATLGINGTEDLYAKPGITTTTAIMGKNADEMGMDDFFKLMTAQMSNQDMMNPQSNTEFIAQMAQFTTLQGMKSIQENQLSSYAVSYVGKNVKIAKVNEQTDELETIEGVVERVSFYDGKPKVIVNGTAYDLHTVMEVVAPGTSSSSPSTTDFSKMSYSQMLAAFKDKNVTLTYQDAEGKNQTVTGLVTAIEARMNEKNELGYYFKIGDKEYLAKDVNLAISTSQGTSGSGDNSELDKD